MQNPRPVATQFRADPKPRAVAPRQPEKPVEQQEKPKPKQSEEKPVEEEKPAEAAADAQARSIGIRV